MTVHAELACLLGRVGSRLYALSMTHLVEMMRALPIEPAGDGPLGVIGWSLIRGERVAVVDVARLSGQTADERTRFVTARLGARTWALALSGVLGPSRIRANVWNDARPLLTAEARIGLAHSDGELLAVLDEVREVPE